MIQKACEISGFKYCGVTKDVELKSVLLLLTSKGC